MMHKNIKFLIPFIFLLTSNANFQGMEMIRSCCQALTKMLSIKSKENIPENPKSILKKRQKRNLGAINTEKSDKKVTFDDKVTFLE